MPSTLLAILAILATAAIAAPPALAAPNGDAAAGQHGDRPAARHASHAAHDAPTTADPHGGHGAPAADPHAAHGAPAAADPHAGHRAQLAAGSAAAEATAAAGMAIPDVPVVTHDGREVSFYRDLVAGRTVAINFVFTTCTTVCPPMGAYFGKLQDVLGERFGRDVHLISVSVDPLTDTAERMAAWGARFGARDGWTLVTGDVHQVERLLKALGVFTPDAEDHAPVALIGNDAAGAWTRASGLARPAELAALIDAAAAAGGGR